MPVDFGLGDLHVAVAVARHGSIAAAAQDLRLSQPTISKAIARLERAAGIRVFERLARGMRPTELGQMFLARAGGIDLAALDLDAELRDLRDGRRGPLRFGVGRGIPDRWIAAAVHRLSGAGLTLHVQGGMADTLLRAVALCELEFAIVGLSDPPERSFAWQRLRADPLVPVAPRGHPLAAATGPVDWPALARARWVVTGSRTAAFAEFVAAFAGHGHAVEPVVHSVSSDRELLLAATLGALLLIPRSLAEEPAIGDGFRIVEVEGGWPSRRQVGLVRRAGAYLSPAADRGLRLLASLVGRRVA